MLRASFLKLYYKYLRTTNVSNCTILIFNYRRLYINKTFQLYLLSSFLFRYHHYYHRLFLYNNKGFLKIKIPQSV